MKKIHLLSFFLLFSFNLLSQNINLNDLQTICSKTNWEYVNQYLQGKGWEYYSSSKGSTDKYSTITWSFNKISYNDKALAWFYLYTYEGLPNKISFSVFNKDSYSKIQNSLAGYGYKLIDSKIEDDQIISDYGNSKYSISIKTKKRKDSDSFSSDSFTEYEFLFIKKNGVYDPDNGTKIVYYDDGISIDVEYTLKNGNFDGPTKNYYRNGKIKLVGYFKNNKKEGIWEDYDENGDIKRTLTFKDGELNGAANYYEDGKLVKKENYNNGMLSGESMTQFFNYDANVTFELISNYSNDKKNGREEFYVKEENNSKRLLNYKNFVNDLKEGPFQKVTGDSLIIGSYKNDKLDGSYKVYVDISVMTIGGIAKTNPEELTISSKGYYKNDLKEGEWEYYDITGSLIEKGKYYNDLKSGPWESYYLNYVDYETGKQKFYSGELYLIDNYQDGVKNGESIRTSFLQKKEVDCPQKNKGSGNCTKLVYLKRNIVSNYKNDKLNGKFQIKDSLDQIIFKGQYKNDEQDGFWLESYTVNDGIYGFEEGNYVNGLKTGKWIEYLDNKENIFYESNYRNGILEEIISYNSEGKIGNIKSFKRGELSSIKEFDVSNNRIVYEYRIYGENINFLQVELTKHFEDKSRYVSNYTIIKPTEKISHFDFIKLFNEQIQDEKRGYLDGDMLLTYSDGTPSIKGGFYKQVKIGVWEYFYPKQNVKVVITYTDFSNKKKSEMYYTMDNKMLFDGDFIYVNSENQTREERRIREGLRNGNTIYYNKNEEKIKKEKYKDGLLKD